MKKTRRYQIVNEDGKKISGGFRSAKAALQVAAEMSSIWSGAQVFNVEPDRFGSVLAYILKVLSPIGKGILKLIRIVYFPIFYLGFGFLILIRIQLAIAYTILLQPRVAKNVFKNMFK